MNPEGLQITGPLYLEGCDEIETWSFGGERMNDLYVAGQCTTPHGNPEMGFLAWNIADYHISVHAKTRKGSVWQGQIPVSQHECQTGNGSY